MVAVGPMTLGSVDASPDAGSASLRRWSTEPASCGCR